jgi:hypothetical protein
MKSQFLSRKFCRKFRPVSLVVLFFFPASFLFSCVDSGDGTNGTDGESSSSSAESSSSWILSAGNTGIDIDTNSYSREFEANYELLYGYYYKAGDELDSIAYYEKNADPNRYKVQFRDVADVLFMYAAMSDLFTRYYPYAYAKELWSNVSGDGVDASVFLDSLSGIPVIRITEFLASTEKSDLGTSREFQDALEKTAGARSTVLDLRGNPGGNVDQCESMAAMLLSKGDTIVVEKRTESDAFYEIQKDTTIYNIATDDGIGHGRYYVLLLDTASASCTEIFASSLTSNLKAPVIGMTSFGKGIGQYYFSTPDSGLATITGLRFFDKSGRSYHTYGIVPDFEVPDSLKALNKAVELAEEGTYKRTAGYGTVARPYWQQVKAKKASASHFIQPFERGGAYLLVPWKNKQK